jgi:hypothetical protein
VANTAKIALFAIQNAVAGGYAPCFISHLRKKFVTWRINGISPSINELKRPYQPNNNGIGAGSENPVMKATRCSPHPAAGSAAGARRTRIVVPVGG